MHTIMLRRCLVGLLTVVAGCDHKITICSAELRSSLLVDVVDSRTGAPIALGATVIVRGTSVVDSVMVTMPESPSLAYVGWEDRITPGTYSVTVGEAGYMSWTSSNVRVVSNGCHVDPPTHLTASLVRITP